MECPFTKEVMCMEPEAFVAWIVKSLHVKSMVVGSDFRFGHNRKGDHILLEKLSATYGYTLRVVDKIQYEGRDISSTFVREQIIKGNMEKANDLLGYPFFVKSEVIHGRPPKGVYATAVEIGGKYYTGVTNVGCKPTVNHSNKVNVETHILDFSGDLYGYELKVSFYSFIRPEQRFSSVEMLKEQMERDIETSRSRMMSINGDM